MNLWQAGEKKLLHKGSDPTMACQRFTIKKQLIHKTTHHHHHRHDYHKRLLYSLTIGKISTKSSPFCFLFTLLLIALCLQSGSWQTESSTLFVIYHGVEHMKQNNSNQLYYTMTSKRILGRKEKKRGGKRGGGLGQFADLQGRKRKGGA